MEKIIILQMLVLLELTRQVACVVAKVNHPDSRSLVEHPNPQRKRNTKFLIPALISHVYHQGMEGDFPFPSMLNRPFVKKFVRKENEKIENAEENLEHKTIVGNPRREENVRNVLITKCPGVKSKTISVKIEPTESLENNKCQHEHKAQDDYEYSETTAETDTNAESVINVRKQYSPRKSMKNYWYSGSPIMWPPPITYGNSYDPQPHQFPNLPFSNYRSVYSVHPSFQHEGFLQHILGTQRNKSPTNSHLTRNDGVKSDNLVAQERKFMVTNITKYVLDFYCPHCGGEISVSKNKNRGTLFGGGLDEAISINKGRREPDHLLRKTTSSDLGTMKTVKRQLHR